MGVTKVRRGGHRAQVAQGVEARTHIHELPGADVEAAEAGGAYERLRALDHLRAAKLPSRRP